MSLGRGSLLRAAVVCSTAQTSSARSLSTPVDTLARFRRLADSVEQKPRTLITGSLGQLGRGLASVLKYMYGRESVVMSDIFKPKPEVAAEVEPFTYIDILNSQAIEEAVVNHRIDTLVHFSALLSAVGETNVPLAIRVNCEGVQNVLEVARRQNLKVFIPSTIGAFGPTTPRVNTPDLTIQRPKTIYGVSKVYAELLGEYYASRFGVDFRSLRFPGIISATKPGGGTTDYAIQIFYDALTTGRHVCYLRPDTRLPMMFDTDCMASVVFFLAAPQSSLSLRTYNVSGFSFTPEEIGEAIHRILPDFTIEYQICPTRQAIADSWPQSLDDSQARADWGWHPEFDLSATVEVMLGLVQRSLAAQQPQTPTPKAVAV